MIKCFIPEIDDNELRDIKNDAKDKPPQARKVISVYHYLYRFSLSRLNKLINDPSMIKICWYYFNCAGSTRIERSSTMRKYSKAYFEAIEILKNYDYYLQIVS